MTRLLTFAWLAAAALALAACDYGGDDGDEPDGQDEPGLAYVWQSVNRPVDFERLRELMTEELRTRTEDEALLEEVACFPTGVVARVTDKQLQRDGDRARIHVDYEVTGSGTAEERREVTRTWEFQRAQGGWLISSLPECPYEPGATPEDGG